MTKDKKPMEHQRRQKELLELMRTTSKQIDWPHMVLIGDDRSPNVHGWCNAPASLILSWSYHVLVRVLDESEYPDTAHKVEKLMVDVLGDMDRRSRVRDHRCDILALSPNHPSIGWICRTWTPVLRVVDPADDGVVDVADVPGVPMPRPAGPGCELPSC